MTSVICWKNKEDDNDNLWIVADSRISNPGQVCVKVLNDMCPKVFSIPIKIRFSDKYQFTQEVSSICFAFSGSTLVAQITKDILSLMLTSLNEMDDSHKPIAQHYIQKHLNLVLPIENETKNTIESKLPSLLEIAELTVEILKSVLLSCGTDTTIEILISGFCFKQRIFQTFTISSKPPFEIDQITAQEFIYSIENKYCILGDHKSEVLQSILNEEKSTNELVSRRAPLYALATTIDNQSEYLSIGGYLQLAVCNNLGCRINGFVKSDVNFFYAGFKPHTQGKDGNLYLKTLGRFIVSPPTMWYPEKSDHNCNSGTLQREDK